MQIKLSDGSPLNIDIVKKHVKNITLRIYPNGKVKISAPTRMPDTQIHSFVHGKAGWIEKHVEKSRSRQTCGKNEIRLLGMNYRLVVLSAAKNEVEVTDDAVIVSVKGDGQWQSVLSGWWRKNALEYYGLYVDKWMDRLAETGIKRPHIRIRKMKTMWGSCSWGKGEIRYNYYLFCTPPACVEYVVLHELAHLLYPNHGERFKAFMTKWMPDWKERKNHMKLEPGYSELY